MRRRGAQAKEHPERRAPVPGATSEPGVDHRSFEDLVEAALDALPENVSQLLDNVAIVIADEPTLDQLESSHLRPYDTLYGLYEGVSPINYGASWAIVPNKITIFRLPLEADFPDPARLAEEVQRTVLHEIGHHAGLDHEALRKARFR